MIKNEKGGFTMFALIGTVLAAVGTIIEIVKG